MKHGTCATGISSMETEREFFSTVLSLHEKMNFTKILTDNDIFPSYDKTYRVATSHNCNYTSNICCVPVLPDGKINSYKIKGVGTATVTTVLTVALFDNKDPDHVQYRANR